MGTANISAEQELRSRDPVWYSLGEFSLSEFMTDLDRTDGLTAKVLWQTVQEFGMSPECVADIDMTLTGFAKEAWARSGGKVASPECIRIFCQDKMMATANAAKTSMPCDAEPGMEPTPAILFPGPQMRGGWGYFLIERGRNLATGSSVNSDHSIDLYLYTEGE